MKIALLLLLFIPSLVFAQQECDSEDFVCHQQHRAEISGKLKKADFRLRRLNADIAARFRISQKLWIRFTEADCRYESEPAANSQGSGYGRVYERCMDERYSSRLKDVEEMIEWLEKP